MKILCRSNAQKNRYSLEIIAVLNTDEVSTGSVAAAHDEITIEYRDLDFKYQLTREQFSTYQNFVRSAISIVKNFGFEIVDKYQSNDSYSYYYQFTPSPYAGFEDNMLELDVKFRLSDHYRKDTSAPDTSTTTKSSGVVFKEFVVEGVTHSRVEEALLEIRRICEDLKVGDYSRLF